MKHAAVPVLGFAALSACVAAPVAAPAGRAGLQAVTVDGIAFDATIAPGGPGMVLTAQGARPVNGLAVTVRRSGGALAMDEGALAKKAARAGCAAAGGRFSDAAIGAYDRAGGWVFAGACA